MQQYLPANLDLLYQAIGEQAELDFQQALKREFPHMATEERATILEYWRRLSAKAEARMSAEQGE